MTNDMYTAKIAGTGAAITVKPGFSPRYVRIINTEGLCTLEWTKDLTDGYGYKILTGINATADTVSLQSLISTGGITPDGDGLSFSIGADTDVNVSGEDLLVIAFR